MKVLHLIHDNKFFGFVASLFARLAGVQSRYVAFAPGDAPLEHIGALTLWRRVGRRYFLSADARADLAWCDCLIVHFVEPWGALLMLRAPARVTAVWSGWGGDYLALLPEAAPSALQPETAALLDGIRRRQLRRGLREGARRLYERGLARVLDRPLLMAAAARADLFSAPLREDFEMLQQALGPRFRARFAQLNYASVEQTFRVDAGGADATTGGDILLGNSATATNNHAEMLRLLAAHDLDGRKVVVPLSYGDPDYRDAILALGRRLLGARFEPLTQFMPLAQFNAVIARCSCAIMNQRRQQAIGNIGVALHRGARLYLDESGVLYRFFRDRGAHVFSTRALEAGGDGAFEPLSPAERTHNRAILDALWSDATVKRNAEAFVATVAAVAARQ